MNYWQWLLAVCVFGALFAESKSKWIKKHKKYASPFIMKDEVDERGFNEEETHAIGELKSRTEARSTADSLRIPDCDFANWTCPYCCLGFNFLNGPKEFCMQIILDLRRLKLSTALTFQDGDDEPVVLFQHEFLFSKFCIGIPLLPKIEICGHIYYFDYNYGSPLYVETCLTIIIASVLELRFYCVRLLDGVLQQTFEIEPEEKGLFAVLFKKDRVIFEFNLNIPEELWSILEGLGDVVKFITDTIIVALKSALASVWDAISNFFSSPQPFW